MKLGSKVVNDISAVVTRVLDGDTVECTVDCLFDIKQADLQIRLFGIDTPEMNSSKPDLRIKARAAKERLTELVLGKEVKLTSYKNIDANLDTDKFGRYLAIIHLEGVNINQQLIDEGHGVVYFGGKK